MIYLIFITCMGYLSDGTCTDASIKLVPTHTMADCTIAKEVLGGLGEAGCVTSEMLRRAGMRQRDGKWYSPNGTPLS